MKKPTRRGNNIGNKFSPEELRRSERQKQRWTWWDRENEPTMKFFDCAHEFCGNPIQKSKTDCKFEDIPDFFWSRSLTEAYFEMLAKCAVMNAEAAVRLHYVATLAVQYLNEAALKAPHNFHPISKTDIIWPGYLSDHPEAESLQKKDLFPQLHLGEKSGIRLKGSKYSLNTLETAIAMELWGKMEYYRKDNRIVPDETRSGKIIAEIKKLPTLSRNNFQLWWKVAEKMFLLKFGEAFEENAMFARYWDANHATYKDHDNARALIRRDIKKKIQQSFRSIAAKPSAV